MWTCKIQQNPYEGSSGFAIFFLVCFNPPPPHPSAVPSSVITLHLPVNSGEVLIGKQRVPIYLSSHLISDGKLHRLLLRRPKLLLLHTHTHTQVQFPRSTQKKTAKNARKPEGGKKKFVFYFSAVRSIILPTNTFHTHKHWSRQSFPEMQTAYNSSPSKYCAATTVWNKEGL